jgi:GNAT superfamily N-acetyltransferase
MACSLDTPEDGRTDLVEQHAGAYALLTDGSSVQIRQALPADADAVRAMHAAMSPDNMYLRFFSLSPGNADREAERVCRAAAADRVAPDHVALLACRGSEVVRVATYEMNDNAPTADVALAVADRFHRHGIATLLLEHLVSIARQHYVRAFTATTWRRTSQCCAYSATRDFPYARSPTAGLST